MKKWRTEITDAEVAEIESVINHTFVNKSLLRQAFTRSSFVHEQKQLGNIGYRSNEVLEFYGDSVLGAAVVDCLLSHYTKTDTRSGLITGLNEGDFTIIKSNLSRKTFLSERMDILGLSRYLLASNGDYVSHAVEEKSIKEDLFESIIGAVYVDSGHDFRAACRTVETMLDPVRYLDAGMVDARPSTTLLKECCEKYGFSYDFDTSLPAEGPDNDTTYTVICRVSGLPDFTGKARNRKTAKADAAAAAYKELQKRGYSVESKAKTEEIPLGDNPKDTLQKYGDKLKIRPSYATEEHLRDPSARFHTVCTFGEFVGHGAGNTKKEAENKAAANIFKKIAGQNGGKK